ncbi:MBL fold metallo-hydrolase [Thauera sp. Sel9]|uniref:MBL fold metallo-hydrolase n=1 Tax=Thauera sp. Sel9 TaxID=2974299 RepID=UPI0021E1A4AC|nr:MBL fold metallo-hydrolase [Thauera sp. Sel9]MCV2217839.1 MBL fold metallo-hydrolase [Thauera sp. Sel9]
MQKNAPSRLMRPLLHCAAAVLIAAGAGFATAAAPQLQTQVPGYYRMMLGDIEVTALYDGAIEIDTGLLKNLRDEDRDRLLARHFLQVPKVQTAVNAYLINTGDKLVLVDAGAAHLFGPSLGHVASNLRAAGYDPAQVDVVLLTHLHGDHMNGLIDADGKAVFANAEIWSAQADNDFWLNDEVAAKAAQEVQPFFKMARDASSPYRAAGQWKTFSTDRDIVPDIASVAASGHTPGHSGYLVGSGERKLLIWGDIVHNHAVQFAQPEVSIEFDVDSEAAVATRKQIFARSAKEKLLVGGMHLPFPGIGHVRAEGEAYEWVPLEFNATPQ